jgi:hypothetical protein
MKSLQDRLEAIGVPVAMRRRFDSRQQHSQARLDELKRRLRQLPPIVAYPALTIYAAGSYGRREASSHSDIGLFFIHADSDHKPVDDPHLKGIRVMSAVIREMEEGMEFPPPSNDGQFLNIISLSNMLAHLGGAEDDYKNHFTARMLLLLESSPVYGEAAYDQGLDGILDAYLRDYEDHAEDFRPTFLVNDILRFWKTLCLNYEHRRNQAVDARKLKQKIRNFKLGYSRLMTCFATIALLSSYNHISKEEMMPICKMSPLERLLTLYDRKTSIQEHLKSAIILYHWFLEKTELSTPELERYFSTKNNRITAFANAKRFGDEIYRIVKITSEETGTFHYLVYLVV